MASINISRNKTLPDSSSKSDFHDLVDTATATISNIVGADISTIVTDNKIGGSSLFGLQSTPSGASIPNTALEPLTDSNLVSAFSLYNMASLPTTAGAISTLDSISGQAFTNLSSAPSAASQLPYWSIVSSLASGALISYDGSTNFVGSNVSNTSNVIFHYQAALEQVVGSDAGEYTGTSLTPASITANYRFIMIPDNTQKTVLESKWTKIAGISTVTVYGEIWQAHTNTANLEVDIGGQSGNASGTASQTTPEWVNFTVDVSGLTNGTVYDIDVRLSANAGVDNVYMGTVVMFGS